MSESPLVPSDALLATIDPAPFRAEMKDIEHWDEKTDEHTNKLLGNIVKELIATEECKDLPIAYGKMIENEQLKDVPTETKVDEPPELEEQTVVEDDAMKKIREEEEKLQTRILMETVDPRRNCPLGPLPNHMDLELGHTLLYPPLPKFKLHVNCYKDPDCTDKKSMVIHKRQVHGVKAKICECLHEFSDSADKIYKYIVKKCTAPVTKNICMPIVYKQGGQSLYIMAAAVVQRAIFVECMAHKKRQGGITDEFEAYVGTEDQVETFFDACVYHLQRNGRAVNSGKGDNNRNKTMLLFRHATGRLFISIKIFPHKAIRKAYHPNPASHVYINDAHLVDGNMPSVRTFLANTAFGRTNMNGDMRRVVVMGEWASFEAQVTARQMLDDFRTYAQVYQVDQVKKINERKQQRAMEQQNTLNELSNAADKLQHGEEKLAELNDIGKPPEAVEMTDVEFEVRKQSKLLKEQRLLEEQLSKKSGGVQAEQDIHLRDAVEVV